MGREKALATILVALLGLGAWRARPVRAQAWEPACSAQSLGHEGALVRCGGAAPLSGGERRVLGLPLDLNVATAAELEALPGIGAGLAARIVAYRAEHGPFMNVEALEGVSGIGPAKLRLLAGRVTAQPARR